MNAHAPLPSAYELITAGQWPLPSNPRDESRDMTDLDIWQLV